MIFYALGKMMNGRQCSGRPNRIPNLFGIFGENRTEYLEGKTELLIVL